MTSNSGKRYFYAGVAAGIVGGVLANLFVALIMKLIDLGGAQPPWAIVLECVFVTIALVTILWSLFRDIDKLKEE
ncbi:MAG: hypothetical protein M0Q91_16180 [Methanoregula sp.]|jgi:hypothetical protein|nr:hypothetical protein [Methanoregula sp.]